MRGLEGREKEVWLACFVDTLVMKFDCPNERASYLSFCSRYPRHILEEAYARVCDTPRERIRKSPGALFVHLVKSLSRKL